MDVTEPRAMLARAKQAYVERRFAEARDCIEQALRGRKPPPETHLWAGLIDFQCGDIRASVSHYSDYLLHFGVPDHLHAIALFNRAIALDCCGQWDQAAADYTAAMGLFASLGQTEYVHQCYRNLAWTYCEQGRLDDAERSLEATEGHATTADAHWAQRTARAYLATLRGDYAPVQELAEEITDNTPRELACMVVALEALAFHRLGDEMGCTEALKKAQDMLAACWDPRCKRVIARVHSLRRARNLS